MKSCVAGLIFNNEDKLLLLKRSHNDKFCPSDTCLPGGGVDEGETPDQAIVREISEEILCKVKSIQLLETVKLPDIHIHYYYVVLEDQDKEVVLDQEEHQQREWCSKEEWLQKDDLILDLKQHLIDIFDKHTLPILPIEKEEIEIPISEIKISDDKIIFEIRLEKLQEELKGNEILLESTKNRLNKGIGNESENIEELKEYINIQNRYQTLINHYTEQIRSLVLDSEKVVSL